MFKCYIESENNLNIYQKISTIVALFLYLPLARQILKGEVKQNIATWILWGSLDVIVAISLFLQNGNWHLPTAYVGGCTLIIICLLKARVMTWGRFETLMTFIVIACLIGWWQSGPRLATILSTAGMVAATLPQIRDAYRSPFDMPLKIYAGYTVVNMISTMGGAGWTVEDRLYPLTCTILCALVVLAACRKYLIMWDNVRIPSVRMF